MKKILAILVATSYALSFSANAAERLLAGQSLSNGQYINSPNGKYTLIMQTDGSLVMYRATDGSVRYSMEKHGTYAIMQTDGNFVEYAGTTPLWDTGTWNCCAGYDVYLEISDDGNLAVIKHFSSPSMSYAYAVWEIGADPVPSPGPVYPLEKLQPPGPPPSNVPPNPDRLFMDNSIAGNPYPRY